MIVVIIAVVVVVLVLVVVVVVATSKHMSVVFLGAWLLYTTRGFR